MSAVVRSDYGGLPLASAGPNPRVNEAELQRYLSETPWFPTALLPAASVTWEGIDERSARATIDDGDRFLLRVSQHDGDSEKRRFLETTETATFVCYEASTNESWTVHVRGPIRKRHADTDETTLNEWFQPFRLFGEGVEAVEFSLYDLGMETVIGRKTVE